MSDEVPPRVQAAEDRRHLRGLIEQSSVGQPPPQPRKLSTQQRLERDLAALDEERGEQS